MSKKELKLHAVVAPMETVVVSTYDKEEQMPVHWPFIW